MKIPLNELSLWAIFTAVFLTATCIYDHNQLAKNYTKPMQQILLRQAYQQRQFEELMFNRYKNDLNRIRRELGLEVQYEQ